MEHSFPLDIYPYQKSTKSPSKTHTQHAHTQKKTRSISNERKTHEFLCLCLIFELHRPSPFFIFHFLLLFFSAQKNTRKRKEKIMSKSDALATKEMPFRVYMGYDSHEDITFEVRATRCSSSSSSIRRTTSSVFVASRIVYCACVLDDKIMIFGRRTRDVERCVCLSLG